jgi:hypothetical protein
MYENKRIRCVWVLGELTRTDFTTVRDLMDEVDRMMEGGLMYEDLELTLVELEDGCLYTVRVRPELEPARTLTLQDIKQDPAHYGLADAQGSVKNRELLQKINDGIARDQQEGRSRHVTISDRERRVIETALQVLDGGDDESRTENEAVKESLAQKMDIEPW